MKRYLVLTIYGYVGWHRSKAWVISFYPNKEDKNVWNYPMNALEPLLDDLRADKISYTLEESHEG